jgi:hypothetical protein
LLKSAANAISQIGEPSRRVIAALRDRVTVKGGRIIVFTHDNLLI